MNDQHPLARWLHALAAVRAQNARADGRYDAERAIMAEWMAGPVSLSLRAEVDRLIAGLWREWLR